MDKRAIIRIRKSILRKLIKDKTMRYNIFTVILSLFFANSVVAQEITAELRYDKTKKVLEVIVNNNTDYRIHVLTPSRRDYTPSMIEFIAIDANDNSIFRNYLVPLALDNGEVLRLYPVEANSSIKKKHNLKTILRDKYSETKRIKVLCELLIISEDPQLLREKRDTLRIKLEDEFDL